MKPEIREMEMVNLNKLLEETVMLYKSEAIRHETKIDLTISARDIYVHGDKIQLQQVLLNFLSNACQALDSIEPAHRKINILQVVDGNSVRVSVEDTGIGINPELLGSIFKPFVTSRKNGFGIGLAISKSIIERHHGKIMAENAAGGGARFCFTLKVVKHEK